MANTATEPTVRTSKGAEFITIAQALALWELSPNAFRRKRRAAGIRLYAQPTDDRVRLMKRADVEAALGPARAAHTAR